MIKVLQHVARKERFHIPDPALDSILQSTNGNLRKALLVFEAMRMQKPDLSGDIEVAKADWETYCGKIADSIVKEQSAARLLEVRGKVYELLSHCIPPTVVLKVSQAMKCCKKTDADFQTIAERLVDKVDDDLKPQIIHWAAHYASPSLPSECLGLINRN
jgi:replication factor C subunit 3/5